MEDHLPLLIIHTSQAVVEVVRVITTVLLLLLTTAAHHRCLHLNTLTIMESTHQHMVVGLIPPQEEVAAVVTIKFNTIHNKRMVVLVGKMMKTMTII
jgi:hypothetical protein